MQVILVKCNRLGGAKPFMERLGKAKHGEILELPPYIEVQVLEIEGEELAPIVEIDGRELRVVGK